MRTFVRLNSERGMTIIFVTHEPEVAAYTRRVIHAARRPRSSPMRRRTHRRARCAGLASARGSVEVPAQATA